MMRTGRIPDCQVVKGSILAMALTMTTLKVRTSAKSISVQAEWFRQGGRLHQCRQRHPGDRLLHGLRQYDASHCISPSDRSVAICSRSVGILCQTNTVGLVPTVTIRRNRLIKYISKMSMCPEVTRRVP